MQFRSNVIRRITTNSGLTDRKNSGKIGGPGNFVLLWISKLQGVRVYSPIIVRDRVNALIARHLVLEPIGNQLLPSRSSKVKLSYALLCQIQFRNYFDFMTTMIYIHRYQKRISVIIITLTMNIIEIMFDISICFSFDSIGLLLEKIRLLFVKNQTTIKEYSDKDFINLSLISSGNILYENDPHNFLINLYDDA